MVTDATAVDVRETSGDVLELRVASNDVGRIIGRDGHNISALRVLVAAVGARSGHKVTLELIEP